MTTTAADAPPSQIQAPPPSPPIIQPTSLMVGVMETEAVHDVGQAFEVVAAVRRDREPRDHRRSVALQPQVLVRKFTTTTAPRGLFLKRRQ